MGWLAEDFGMGELDAYQLVTQAARTPVANVVDPNHTVVCKIRKEHMPSPTVFGGTHERLRGMVQRYRLQGA